MKYNLECIQKKLRSLEYNKLKFINCTLIFHLNHFDVNKKKFFIINNKSHFDINEKEHCQPF